MIKVGYFTQTLFGVSETFIYDLVTALNKDEEIDLTYISNHKSSLKTEYNLTNIPVNFSHKNITRLKRIYRITNFLGFDAKAIELKLKKKLALKELSTKIKQPIDVAYVDFADTAVLLMEYFEKLAIPFIVHVHGHDITQKLNNHAYKKELLLLFEKADFFITASQYMKRRLILLGCNEDKIKVIKYGLDINNITPLPWTERIKKSPSIIFLGRLTEKKSPITLIHTFNLVKKEIPNASLSIIGDGPLKDEVIKTINTLGLNESVKLYGALSREESFPILNQHWVYAQHSVTSSQGDTEGFAISLAEAALHEIPVVSTIHNGITENVIDGETGYLVPEYDYVSMSKKIIELINNPSLAEKMGASGRKHIIAICNTKNRVDKIKELINQLKVK